MYKSTQIHVIWNMISVLELTATEYNMLFEEIDAKDQKDTNIPRVLQDEANKLRTLAKQLEGELRNEK